MRPCRFYVARHRRDQQLHLQLQAAVLTTVAAEIHSTALTATSSATRTTRSTIVATATTTATAPADNTIAQLLDELPASHKALFGHVMFAVWGKRPNDYRPVLVLSPTDVQPGGLRDTWAAKLYAVRIRRIRLIFLIIIILPCWLWNGLRMHCTHQFEHFPFLIMYIYVYVCIHE
jgi:acetylornithine deacetylase/succinyl-diaminopimelate desuccinylase-like protein